MSNNVFYDRVQNVILSCKTPTQLNSALKYVEMAKRAKLIDEHDMIKLFDLIVQKRQAVWNI